MPEPEPMEALLDAHLAAATGTRDLLPAARAVAQVLIDAYERGGILYAFGNGGSAADAQHLAGELVGHYSRDRRPLGAVALSTDPSVVTCIANDYGFDDVFARQVEGLARPGDVVAAFTTSGTSPNVVTALAAARAKGATTVLFAGGTGGDAKQHADHALLIPSTETPRIQEMHTFLLHAISDIVDVWADEGGAS
jgi:D-sedoheptulose 7-phosphate isomerase